MRSLPASTGAEVATAAGLDERYVPRMVGGTDRVRHRPTRPGRGNRRTATRLRRGIVTRAWSTGVHRRNVSARRHAGQGRGPYYGALPSGRRGAVRQLRTAVGCRGAV